MTQDQVTSAVAAMAIVAALLGQLKPLIEQVPFARPGSPAHDVVLRILNFAANVAVVLALQATAGTLDMRQWLTYAVVAAGQAIGSHTLYQLVKPGTSQAQLAQTLAGLNEVKVPVEPPATPAQ